MKRQAAAPELTLLFLDGVGAHSEVGAQCAAGMGRTGQRSAVLRVKHGGVGERTRLLSVGCGCFVRPRLVAGAPVVRLGLD